MKLDIFYGKAKQGQPLHFWYFEISAYGDSDIYGPYLDEQTARLTAGHVLAGIEIQRADESSATGRN